MSILRLNCIISSPSKFPSSINVAPNEAGRFDNIGRIIFEIS